MAFPVPVNLSPSRVEAFTSCPLAFRFASIEKLPEPPRAPTTKGSLVHRALELLFADHRPADRTLEAGLRALARATAEYEAELAAIGLDPADDAALRADTVRLVRRYFEMEDPRAVADIGVELYLEASVGRLTLRGIIDRLELDDDGRSGRHRLQDRPAPHGRARAAPAGRRALLRLPLRPGLRPAPGADPADVPQHRRGDHRAAQRAVHPVPAPADGGRLAGGGAGLRRRPTSGLARARCATTAPSSRGARPSAATRTAPSSRRRSAYATGAVQLPLVPA